MTAMTDKAAIELLSLRARCAKLEAALRGDAVLLVEARDAMRLALPRVYPSLAEHIAELLIRIDAALPQAAESEPK